jgi:MscS family membrane protein
MDWKFLDQKIAGNTVSQYLWFAGILLLAFLLRKTLAKGIAYLGGIVACRFSNKKDMASFTNLVAAPVQRLSQTVLYYIAVLQLDKPLNYILIHRKSKEAASAMRVIDLVDHVFLFFSIIFSTLIVFRLIDFIYRIQIDDARKDLHKNKMQVLPLMKEIGKVIVGVIALFWLLGAVFHVNVPALITGLGIGGIAIALAGKESVENLFASIMILSDKPFEVDDVIKIGSIQGKIERIGFRSTGLRHADGALYIVPNKKLIDETLENLSRSQQRRVQLFINIKYGIGTQVLQKIMEEIRAVLATQEDVQEPIDVGVETFGEGSFQLLVQYFLPYPYNTQEAKNKLHLHFFDILTQYVPSSSVAIQANQIVVHPSHQSNKMDNA